jgi:hypothetical protein
VHIQIEKRVNIVKMTAMTSISGYLGIPKGISSAPQIVLRVDKNKENNPAHKYGLIFNFD